MPSAPRPGAAGPLGAVRRLLGTLLLTSLTRLQLVGNEILIEKHRALRQLARLLMAVFCFCMALVVAVGLMLVLWWEQRVAILGVLLVLFLGVAVWLMQSLRQSRTADDHPFAASLAELQEDLRQLKAATQDAPQQESR